MSKMQKFIAALVLAAGMAVGGPAEANDGNQGDILHQVSAYDAFASGDYYVGLTVPELAGKGDIGLGTFSKLDGEMVLLDGVFYRIKGDGSVETPLTEFVVGVPPAVLSFACVTWLDQDDLVDFESIASLDELEAMLNERVKAISPNYFYVARIDGQFSHVHLLSQMAQAEPYKPLAKVMEKDARQFAYENIYGTIIAVYSPSYMGGACKPGWQFSFISADRSKGGRLVNAVANLRTRAVIDRTTEIDMRLPYGKNFGSLDFANLPGKNDVGVMDK